MKLMLISSTSELLEPAEVTLTESAASPLHRYCPHLSWSKDLEWELLLVQGSALGTCRLQDGGDRYGQEGTKQTCTVQPGHPPHAPPAASVARPQGTCPAAPTPCPLKPLSQAQLPPL